MALTLRKALDCIDKGIAKARELGFSVAIAVVDEAGHLVACHRMDEAFWVTPEIARAKANASAAFRATTTTSSCSARGRCRSWRTAGSSAPWASAGRCPPRTTTRSPTRRPAIPRYPRATNVPSPLTPPSPRWGEDKGEGRGSG